MKAAFGFENYLYEIGYKPYVFDQQNKQYVTPKGTYPSTMSILDVVWFKGNCRDKNKGIVTGLHGDYKPPTLIYPRPIMTRNGIIIWIMEDDAMNEALRRYTHKEVFEAMYDNTIHLEVGGLNQTDEYKQFSLSVDECLKRSK